MKSELKERAKLFLSSKQNANLLPEILAPLYEKGGPDLLQSVRCFKTIFTEIIPRGDLNHEKHPEDSPEKKYAVWLRDRYIEGIEDLAQLLQTNSSSKLRDLAIETLISCHQLEQDHSETFPKIDHSLIIRLIEALLESGDASPLRSHSGKLREFLKAEILRLDFVCNLLDILEVRSKSAKKPTEDWMMNVLKLCQIIVKAEGACAMTTDGNANKDGARRVFKSKFSKVWSLVMRWDCMTPVIVRQIVSMLPDQVMPHLERPVLMSDFLLESFKIRGPIAVLSLRGIFVLMLNYNFDVPDFYGKLYSLFTLPVLRSNYRERFFRYSADFLASTHLPEYLVAAFAKKLARLSLLAPAPVIPLICQFITNLMISHPGLKILIHNTNTDKVKSIEDDPFDDEELEPSKTRAMESSLWEMKTLQNHVLPSVSQACSFIEKPIPNRAFDLDEVFSNDYDTLFNEETGKKKNIDQVEAAAFGPFEFEFARTLKPLADSVFSSPKRLKT